MTLTGAPPSRTRMSVMSPAAVLAGFDPRRPVVETSRPSSDSARAAAPSGDGSGMGPVPTIRTPVSAGRISSCPYGAASLPATSRSVPRARDPAPDRPRTTSPALASPIAMRRRRPEAARLCHHHAGGRDASPDRKRPDRAQRQRARGRSRCGRGRWRRGRRRGRCRRQRRRRAGGRGRCRGRCRRGCRCRGWRGRHEVQVPGEGGVDPVAGDAGP